jgi:hypothetical protein
MSDVELDPEEVERRRLKKERKRAKKAAAAAAAAAEAVDQEEEEEEVPAPKKRKDVAAEDEVEAPPKKKKSSVAAADADDVIPAAMPIKAGGLQKMFYKAPASLKDFAQGEVEGYRAQHNMSVQGKDADFPNFKPARSFGTEEFWVVGLFICFF